VGRRSAGVVSSSAVASESNPLVGKRCRPRWRRNGKASARKNSPFSPTDGDEVGAFDGEDLKAARC
jgi:hypothetical protein